MPGIRTVRLKPHQVRADFAEIPVPSPTRRGAPWQPHPPRERQGRPPSCPRTSGNTCRCRKPPPAPLRHAFRRVARQLLVIHFAAHRTQNPPELPFRRTKRTDQKALSAVAFGTQHRDLRPRAAHRTNGSWRNLQTAACASLQDARPAAGAKRARRSDSIRHIPLRGQQESCEASRVALPKRHSKGDEEGCNLPAPISAASCASFDGPVRCTSASNCRQLLQCDVEIEPFTKRRLYVGRRR